MSHLPITPSCCGVKFAGVSYSGPLRLRCSEAPDTPDNTEPCRRIDRILGLLCRDSKCNKFNLFIYSSYK